MCTVSILDYIFTKSIDNIIVYGHAVSVEEVEAKNFVLYIGHLGRREPVVQPTISSMKEVALEAHTFGVDSSVGYGGDGGTECQYCFCE
jgi:Zn-dependent metalloprotease